VIADEVEAALIDLGWGAAPLADGWWEDKINEIADEWQRRAKELRWPRHHDPGPVRTRNSPG
jgi:hypothetical protein